MGIYLSSSEAAAKLGVSEHDLFVKSDIVGGPIPSVATPAGRVYLAEDVEAYRTGTLETETTLPLGSEQYLQPFSESCFSESYQSAGSPVIRNVLLCGNKSRNGYAIPASAFGGESGAKRLYLNQPVFLDHAPKGQELSRSVRDIAGVITSVRMVGGRPFGDIDTEGCVAGPTLLALARRKPPSVGMSHIADYTMSTDRKTVLRIEAVHSVDAVFRPATTSSFSEGENTSQSQVASEPLPLILPGTAHGLCVGRC